MNYCLNYIGGLLLAALCSVLLFSCQQRNELPDLEEFTRADRENLGEFLQWEFNQDETFDVLPQTFPYDSLYWYVQTLYNQSTSVMRRDLLSPTNNRWDQNREWTISIIDDDEKIALILPGGNLYLSTSLLKSLERAYELFYFLSFEANLMQEGFLLERLVQEYNAITIRNLISGSAPANSTTLDIIAADFPTLIFAAETVELIDRDAVRTVCQTSVYSQTGIAPFILDAENDNAAWLASRLTYNGRTANIENIGIDGGFECGNLIGNGDYERYVLSALE